MSQTYRDATFTGAPKPSGQDNHAHAVESDGDTFTDCTFDAAGASEALKASQKWGVRVIGGLSIGGVEDCMDFVRGGDLKVRGHQFARGKARQDVTIKGGFRGAEFIDCIGLRFIVAGDYTKYDAKAVMPDGRTVAAAPLRCCRPPVRGGHVDTFPGEPKVWVLNLHSEPWSGDVRNLRLPLVHRFAVALYFWARAKFFKEALAPAPDAFRLDPREL